MSAVTPPLTFANLIVLSGSQTKHPILAQSVNRFFSYGKVLRTCARADASHLWLIKHLHNDSKPTHQIWAQSAESFLRYRSTVCTCALCARAEIPNPLIDYVPSHQGRTAIHRQECSSWSVECVWWKTNTIFHYFRAIELLKVNQGTQIGVSPSFSRDMQHTLSLTLAPLGSG